MIVRLWWPAQEALARNRGLTIAAVAAALTGGLILIVNHPLAWRPASLAALAIVGQVHGLGFQIPAIALALLAIGLGATISPDAIIPSAIVSALLLGPTAELLRGRSPGSSQHAAGVATSWLLLAGQLALIGSLAHPNVLPSVLIVVVGGALLLGGVALPVARSEASSGGLEQTADRGPLLLASAGPLVLAGGWSLLRASSPSLEPLPWWTIILFILFWLGIAQRPWAVIGAALSLLAGLGWTRLTGESPDPFALGLAQVVPLAVWLARGPLIGSRPTIIVATSSAVGVLALTLEGWDSAAIAAAVQCLWLLAAPPLPTLARTGWPSARRSLAHIPPSWRWYGVSKYAHDPIYRQLAGNSRAWGRVADLGCGSGLITALALARPDTTAYLGIDLDRDKLLVAHAVAQRFALEAGAVHLREAALPTDGLPASAFDTVFLLDVLHYWEDAEQHRLLVQAMDLLAPDGELHLRDGVVGGEGDTGRVAFGERFTTFFGINPRRPLNFHDEAGWRRCFAKVGLELLGEESSGAENRYWRLKRPAYQTLTPGQDPGR